MDARALLDSLMGPSRNQSDKDKTGEDFKAKDVCKDYLVGFCPRNGLFSGRVTGQRKQLQMCNKVHSDALKAEFKRHPDEKNLRRQYEEGYLRTLSVIADEADQLVAREKRAARQAGTFLAIPDAVQPQFDKLEADYKKLLEKADLKGSEDAMREAEAVKQELDDIKNKYTRNSAGEEVCEICGIKYVLGDEICQNRADQHFSGSMHEGYSKIRQAISDIKDKQRKHQENPSPDTVRKSKDSKEGKEEKEEKDKDGERDGRKRSRSRKGRDDRGRDDRGRGRRDDSRGRGRGRRERSSDRKRSRSRDRRRR